MNYGYVVLCCWGCSWGGGGGVKIHVLILRSDEMLRNEPTTIYSSYVTDQIWSDRLYRLKLREDNKWVHWGYRHINTTGPLK